MDNVIQEKSFAFAVRIVRLGEYLRREKREYVLSNQVLRSGTSIGANIAESKNAQSDADFISKMNIALKETTETIYWLRVLNATDYLTDAQTESLLSDCVELEKILVSIIKTMKMKVK